jgi:hypothetical protein
MRGERTRRVHTFIVETVDTVDGRAFVVPSQDKEILWVLDLEGQLQKYKEFVELLTMLKIRRHLSKHEEGGGRETNTNDSQGRCNRMPALLRRLLSWTSECYRRRKRLCADHPYQQANSL